MHLYIFKGGALQKIYLHAEVVLDTGNTGGRPEQHIWGQINLESDTLMCK